MRIIYCLALLWPMMGAAKTTWLVVDQFGYLPKAPKVAVLRTPVVGFDAQDRRLPLKGPYRLVRGDELVGVFQAKAFQNAQVDPGSGDITSHIDFTSVEKPGTYFFTDGHGRRSMSFQIDSHVYHPVLAKAVATFVYQRSGMDKAPPLVEPRYADGPSHLMERQCLPYDGKGKVRDLSGGHYDAGDFNKYTNFAAKVWVLLLRAYGKHEDLLLDLKKDLDYALEFFEKMQTKKGGMLSIVAAETTSPPSAAQRPCRYGPVSSSASYSGAWVFAEAAFLAKDPKDRQRYLKRAELAYRFASEHPSVRFYNNDKEHGTEGLGYGQQELSERELLMRQVAAALSLKALRVSVPFDQKAFFAMMPPQNLEERQLLGQLSEGSKEAKAFDQRVRDRFLDSDPYLASLEGSYWGSNQLRAAYGAYFLEQGLKKRAAGYLHSLHGVNPLGLVYLSRMEAWGAERSVKHIFHGWFSKESGLPPPPGFLVGGPNQTFRLPACCPAACGGELGCQKADLTPPLGQPPLKSYLDFHNPYPQNSWQVSEPSTFYQAHYIAFLASLIEAFKTEE